MNGLEFLEIRRIISWAKLELASFYQGGWHLSSEWYHVRDSHSEAIFWK